MSRIVAGPFNRVEGDLEITLDIENGMVAGAQVNSTLYRGFEQIMSGKLPHDALVYTPRICGICSVTQSVAAAQALADCMGAAMPLNGQLSTNLILANENMTDLLTHFYLFFMPDFARDVYRDESWFSDISARFKATSGSATAAMLPARAAFLHLMGLMAGKWPHTLTIQPDGSARAIDKAERIRVLTIISAFRQFLEQVLFGDDLDTINQLGSVAELNAWRQSKLWQHSDFTRFLHVSDALSLHTLGKGTGNFLSYGAYPAQQGYLFAPGQITGGVQSAVDLSAITEDHAHSWLVNRDTPLHPADGETIPDINNPDAYSWCKSPRLNKQVMETGAVARQMVNGNPLIRELVARDGANVHSRVVARLLELALVIPAMQSWIKAIDPAAPFRHHGKLPENGSGTGLVEAARGSLGHWIEIKKGKIHQYQIVAPTSWNFSPRDGDGVPGVLEQALKGAPVRDGETEPVAVQHIVRSFDPCMACTVH